MKEFKRACKLYACGRVIIPMIVSGFLYDFLYYLFFRIFQISSLDSMFGWLLVAAYVCLVNVYIYGFLLSSLDYSTLVQSSPYKKKIQCVYPGIIKLFRGLIGCTIILVIERFNVGGIKMDNTQIISKCFVTFGVSYIILTIIFVLGLKFPYAIGSSPILLIIAMIPIYMSNINLPYTECVLVMYACVIVGEIAGKILTELLYKKELSTLFSRGWRGQLRK